MAIFKWVQLNKASSVKSDRLQGISFFVFDPAINRWRWWSGWWKMKIEWLLSSPPSIQLFTHANCQGGRKGRSPGGGTSGNVSFFWPIFYSAVITMVKSRVYATAWFQIYYRTQRKSMATDFTVNLCDAHINRLCDQFQLHLTWTQFHVVKWF